MAKARREALIVLGMHRSGTSALSGVLAKLGAREPRTLMPSTADNPRGYWESVELMRLHDDILASSGSSWDDWGRFNPGWFDSSAASEFADRLPGVLEQEFGDARLLLLKDPRICRFFPFWIHGLERAGIVPRVVFALRHPLEVAESLRARDGFGRNRALLLWLRHVLDAELASRGVARCFVHFSDLLEDWRSQVGRIARELDTAWPRWSAAVELEIDQHLARELRHQVAAPGAAGGHPQLAQWIGEASDALDRLALGGAGAERARNELDRIREAFDSTGAIYAAVVREHVAAAESAIASSRHALEQSRGELATASSQLGQLQAQLAEHAAANQAQAAELAAARATAVAQEQAASAQAAVNQAQASELAAARAASAEHEQAISAQAAELAATTGKVAQLQARIAEQEEAHRAVADELATARTLADRQAAELDDAEARYRKAEADLGDQALKDASILKLELQVETLRAEAERHGREEEARFRELAKLTERLLAVEARAHEAGEENGRLLARLQASAGEAGRLRELVARMQRSSSWRATAPLRSVAGLFRGRPAADPAQRLRASPLFDQAWYLAQYPDVLASGLDPVEHYLMHGAAENRDPGPGFSTAGYREQHPEVDASGANPLLHAIERAGHPPEAAPAPRGERG